MRGYALLLEIPLTIGYGYAGQVALTSVQAANRHASLAGRADWPPDALYYGGPLAPITVETTGTKGAHTVVTVPLAHKVWRCTASRQPKDRTVSSQKGRTPIRVEVQPSKPPPS